MGYRPVRFCRITNPFAAPGGYASRADDHGAPGHHTGIDFGKSLTPFVPIFRKQVRSSTPGRVVLSSYNATMGNWVGVYYGKDNVTITYWHLSERSVSFGELVERGTVLGRVGNTGNSSAPHLHVQANHGIGFDYHAHVNPGRWVRGKVWAGAKKAQKRIKRKKR